ncbi:MAG: hypothetical protein HY711_02875 [Candidatus Melainabacteria bacterium]|nr:hypothetical protein [Candidatus Melainabacteria bacterium]
MVERSEDASELFLYHGTNCYRRWEINKAGCLLPGRSGLSFFSARPETAYRYARAACLRDMGVGAANSLISEPIVLKVRFTKRTWMQADFIAAEPMQTCGNRLELSVAVLGPIPSHYIVQVFHCTHGHRTVVRDLPVRSFADGTLRQGISRLRHRTSHFRLDTYLLARVGKLVGSLGCLLSGKHTPEATTQDELYRLCQAATRP